MARPGLLRLLRHLGPILHVIHDPDHRRRRRRADLDEIEPLLLGHSQRRLEIQNAELQPVGANDADSAAVDLAIDSRM